MNEQETNAVSNEPTNDNANLEQQTSKVEVKATSTPPTQVVKPAPIEKPKAPYLKESNKNDKYHY